MTDTFLLRRPVRFDEVDAANFVYFPRVAALAHEAMEKMIGDAIPGGYARWLIEERLGLPCVHLAVDYRAPLRFGDEVVVSLRPTKIGDSSVVFVAPVSRGDGTLCAHIDYVVACARLEPAATQPLPAELRALFGRYCAPPRS